MLAWRRGLDADGQAEVMRGDTGDDERVGRGGRPTRVGGGVHRRLLVTVERPAVEVDRHIDRAAEKAAPPAEDSNLLEGYFGDYCSAVGR